MKSKLLLCVVPLFGGVLHAQSIHQYDDFFKIGLGNRGRGSVAYGIRREKFGLQIGLHNDLEISMGQLTDGPLNQDSKFLGNYRTEIGGGIDALYFIGDRYQSFYVGIGLYNQRVNSIWRSPSTGDLYDVGGVDFVRGAYSVGFTGDIGNGDEFGFGYHTLLGWNLSFTRRHRTR